MGLLFVRDFRVSFFRFSPSSWIIFYSLLVRSRREKFSSRHYHYFRCSHTDARQVGVVVWQLRWLVCVQHSSFVCFSLNRFHHLFDRSNIRWFSIFVVVKRTHLQTSRLNGKEKNFADTLNSQREVARAPSNFRTRTHASKTFRRVF